MMTDEMQETQDTAAPSTVPSEKVGRAVLHEENAAEKKEEEEVTITPSEKEAEIVVAAEEKKEISCPDASFLLDQERQLDVTESNVNVAPEEEEEQEEGQDRILLTASSDSTASSEIPPPPPPEQDSVSVASVASVDVDVDSVDVDSVASKEDVPTDEEGSPSKKLGVLGNNETALPESTELSPPSSPPNKNDLSNCKTKVAARLAKAIEDSESHDHRSPELVPLTKEYQNLRKRLRSLIASAKAYQAATRRVEQARSMLFQEYAMLSKGTPLYDHVGKLLDADYLESIEQKGNVSLATTSEGLELQAKSAAQVAEDLGARSLASLQQLTVAHEKINAEDFQQHILDHATEWEQIVTSKSDQELVAVKKLQQDRLHYEKKVDRLRRTVNNLESKGKEMPQALVEKLDRNEQKLKDAWENHEQRAGKLCVLLEQVTQHGWKDLYPLVKNAMKWEVNRLGRENLTYGRLPSTLDAMKASFQQHVSIDHQEE